MSNPPDTIAPAPAELIPTSTAAELLGVTPRQVARLVKRGSIAPALKLPGTTGAYLFDPAHIRASSGARA